MLTVENHHIGVMGIEAPFSSEGLPGATSCRCVLRGCSVLRRTPWFIPETGTQPPNILEESEVVS